MDVAGKRICKYCVRVAPDKLEFFTEEEYDLALECAKKHNTYIKLI